MTGMDALPEVEKRWFMHVGYLAQNWAGVEVILDGIVRQAYVHYEGHKLEPSPPVAFNRKRTFLRKAFAAHPKLAPYSTGLEGMLDTASKLADIRNWTMHSGWADTQPHNALLARYQRSNPLQWEEQTFSLDEIFDAAVECGTLMLALTFFAEIAFGLKTKEEQEQFFRELAGQLGIPLPSDDPAG